MSRSIHGFGHTNPRRDGRRPRRAIGCEEGEFRSLAHPGVQKRERRRRDVSGLLGRRALGVRRRAVEGGDDPSERPGEQRLVLSRPEALGALGGDDPRRRRPHAARRALEQPQPRARLHFREPPADRRRRQRQCARRFDEAQLVAQRDENASVDNVFNDHAIFVIDAARRRRLFNRS